jgi:zinc transport system permease protein
MLVMKELSQLFGFGFFWNALLAAVFTSISCGIIGTYVVSKRMVFISGGITHASFGGIGIAFYFGFDPLACALLFAILSALGIQFFVKNAQVREDSSIAIWWSLGMAIGIIFIFLTPGYTPNVTSYLFGNILTVSRTELLLMALLVVVLTVYFGFFFRKMMFIAFDEEFARIAGIRVNLFNYLMMVLIALTVVLNIRVAGVILILSLLTIPQATANLFTKDFKKMLLLSTLFAFTGTLSGLLLSYTLDIPSGAAIIFTQVVIFIIIRITHFLK